TTCLMYRLYAIIMSATSASLFCCGCGSQAFPTRRSSDLGFVTVVGSSVTTSVSVTTLTVTTGLLPNTTYWFRVGGVNVEGTTTYDTIGSPMTQTHTSTTNFVVTATSSWTLKATWTPPANA